MCLGGHLAYRCALDDRVKAAVCYFATDIHSKTLAQGKRDDSLQRAGDIKGELLMVCFLLPERFPPKRSGSNAQASTDSLNLDLRQKRYPRPSRRPRFDS